MLAERQRNIVRKGNGMKYERNLTEELRELQKANPDCGVVYNGKSAE
jgi:hypothetical protein